MTSAPNILTAASLPSPSLITQFSNTTFPFSTFIVVPSERSSPPPLVIVKPIIFTVASVSKTLELISNNRLVPSPSSIVESGPPLARSTTSFWPRRVANLSSCYQYQHWLHKTSIHHHLSTR